MATVKPDTRVRASAAEAAALSFEGAAGPVRLAYAVDGHRGESESGVPARSVPDLVSCAWDADGCEVRADVEIVASRYCTLDSILRYRADEYQLETLYGIKPDSDELWEGRGRAEETIESEAHRAMQPVVRRGWVDRPNCSTRTLVMGPDGYDPDCRAIISATMPGGGPADIACVRPGSPYVDVSRMPPGTAAEVVYLTGLPTVPPEMADAVRALAAWNLAPRSEPENATTTSTEAGVLSFVIGGVDGAATSLPEVNALISRHGRTAYRVV